MLPVVSPDSHKNFQNFFVSLLPLYYPDPFALSRQTWTTIVQFFNPGLSETDSILASAYSKYGPAPRMPSCMLRSYLLSIKLKVTSITAWVSELKSNPLYAILSGFMPSDVPGAGTFYDFFSLYKEHFPDRSVQQGLINPDSISLAGDGTPVRTQAGLRYKKTCNCSKKHCNCKRLFSQTDCNSGWDSSRNCYFNGYHLYMYVAADSENDLPVFPMLERASRHDMLSFLHSFFTMKTRLPEYRTAKLLLDAAHDADAVYRCCLEENIQTFIDFNEGNLGKYIYKDTFYLDRDGTPVCVKTGKNFRRDANAGNGAARWLAETAASVKHHAAAALTAGLCTQGPLMIQGWLLTRRAGAVSGKRNTRKGLQHCSIRLFRFSCSSYFKYKMLIKCLKQRISTYLTFVRHLTFCMICCVQNYFYTNYTIFVSISQ